MARFDPKNLISIVGGDSSWAVDEWQRTSFYDKKNKTFYIPAMPKDVENAHNLKIKGKGVLKYQGHEYLPLDIIKKLHPDEDFSYIEDQLKEQVNNYLASNN